MIFTSCTCTCALGALVLLHQWHIHTPNALLRCASNTFYPAGSIIYKTSSDMNCKIMHLCLLQVILEGADFHWLLCSSAAKRFCSSEWRWMRWPFHFFSGRSYIVSLVVARDGSACCFWRCSLSGAWGKSTSRCGLFALVSVLCKFRALINLIGVMPSPICRNHTVTKREPWCFEIWSIRF